MANFKVGLKLCDDSKDVLDVEAKSAKEAVERVINRYRPNSILYIDFVAKECDIYIEQPPFTLLDAFTADDIDPKITNYEGQYIIRSADSMRYMKNAKDRTVRLQLLRATGGFGCDPSKIGSKVFVVDADNETYHIQRSNVLGVAKHEAIKRWEQMFDKVAF